MSNINRMDVAAFIEHLGGVAAAAKLLNVHRTTVYGWVEQGSIPALHIIRLHRDHGYSLDTLNAAMPAAMRKPSAEGAQA